MNDKVLSKIKTKKIAFGCYRRTRAEQDYASYARARNAAKAEARRAVRDYEKEVAKLAKRNPKAFYRYANGKLKTRVRVADQRSENGSTVTNDHEKAEMFNKFFSSVYTREDLQSMPDAVTNIGGCYLSTIYILSLIHI